MYTTEYTADQIIKNFHRPVSEANHLEEIEDLLIIIYQSDVYNGIYS